MWRRVGNRSSIRRSIHRNQCETEPRGEGERPFAAGRAFCRAMCPAPRLPSAPVYGYNDWYCAYGKNTATNFLADAAYISECAKGLAVRPYVVMDDGWQKNSPPVVGESGLMGTDPSGVVVVGVRQAKLGMDY